MTRPSEMDRAAFVEAFGGVFEHSPWVAEGAYDAGLPEDVDTPEGLARAMATAMRGAGHEAQLALIRAHPDLAGRLAIAGELTEASKGEQASAGLDACTPAEYAHFAALNGQYKERFGFPFIMAVKGADKAEILAAMERRLENEAEAEFEAALRQIERIALLRLQEILA